MSKLVELLKHMTGPLTRPYVLGSCVELSQQGSIGRQWEDLLGHMNGCYGCGDALHIFPATAGDREIGISAWNDSRSWRQEYADLADGLCFVGEDAFGNQFGLMAEAVWTFDSETGARERVASSIDEWIGWLLSDLDYITGQFVVDEWVQQCGPLERGCRLVPKCPFVVGGKYEVENVYSCEAIKGMRFRGTFARQIRDLPDGAQIIWKIV